MAEKTANAAKKQLPRGYRNNNFGNIRKSGDKWKGLAAEQTDPDFFIFTEAKWGYRALLKLLQNYRRSYGCMTIADFIRRWAPPTENATPAYIKTVSAMLQHPSESVIDIEDKDTLCALAAAISHVENGIKANMDDIYMGWEELQNG